MKPLHAAPSLVEQVHRSILAEIASGQLRPGERIIQEQLAQQLGISRQPVQQALTLLRKEGVLIDAPGRGLQVAPLDLAHVRHLYEVRAVIEGLAFRSAAERNAKAAAARGPALILAGRKAAASGAYGAMIAADMAFHDFIYGLSGNPLVAPAMETHWTQTQRVMGEVLMRDDKPRDIWDQHEALLAAVAAGDGEGAEKLARRHILEAADFMIGRLQKETG
ncbi:GntR family transcriptional regulator [Hydrogenophaga sp.]|uniref:GntR family transcriptional regulator n=1 Tax=Hydrogenophaga sp. TaxID=1904254 RepID=UPI00286E6E5C|nr:GntR family transcriptional regulator [Hydrogenophaga sp.]